MTQSTNTRSAEHSLEISEAEMFELSSQVREFVTNYFAQVSHLPVFPKTFAGKVSDKIGRDVPLEGQSIQELIDVCQTILENSRHNGHPKFFGYVASPSTLPGACADFVASAINSNVTAWRSAPAAADLERTVVRWLGSLIGYDRDAAGLLTSGGSMANLTALMIAHRSRAGSGVSFEGLWNSSAPMMIYASDQIHMSIPKAADILGIGRAQVHTLKSGEEFRLDVDLLRKAIEGDINAGKKPFCVVASAGTVNTGAVDLLDEVADVAREFDIWFHIDGAYGALAALDDTKQKLFKGLERADSISLDPHKWLYVPIDCGCLLFRDAAQARAAFSTDEADYIKVHEENADESFAFWDYGPELSRRFRALKIWFTLSYYGVRRIAMAINEDMRMASYLADLLNDAEDFELLSQPQLSICCFRYVPTAFRSPPSAGDETNLNLLNMEIMHSVQRGGRAYLSSAMLRGKFALRACITNFRTSRSDIEDTIEIIRETGLALINQ